MLLLRKMFLSAHACGHSHAPYCLLSPIFEAYFKNAQKPQINLYRAFGSRGAIAPPLLPKNGAKIVKNRQILAEIWFLPPHFWGLTPNFSVASEGPANAKQRYCQAMLIPSNANYKQ